MKIRICHGHEHNFSKRRKNECYAKIIDRYLIIRREDTQVENFWEKMYVVYRKEDEINCLDFKIIDSNVYGMSK